MFFDITSHHFITLLYIVTHTFSRQSGKHGVDEAENEAEETEEMEDDLHLARHWIHDGEDKGES